VQKGNSTVYTRGGNFRLSPQGQLTTASGDAVQGDNGPITIVGEPVQISSDGTITVNGAISGRLKLVEFPANTQMKSIGGTYYEAPTGVKPALAQDSAVRQGMLESSNVNPVTSVVELISAQREVENMRHVLTMFNSEVDKTAAQDLPRIS
jgi:flagellar basal body rod protein FlgG